MKQSIFIPFEKPGQVSMASRQCNGGGGGGINQFRGEIRVLRIYFVDSGRLNFDMKRWNINCFLRMVPKHRQGDK